MAQFHEIQNNFQIKYFWIVELYIQRWHLPAASKNIEMLAFYFVYLKTTQGFLSKHQKLNCFHIR